MSIVDDFLKTHRIIELIRSNSIKLFVLKTRICDYGEWSTIKDLRAYPTNALWGV
jgi:hypothetical protein